MHSHLTKEAGRTGPEMTDRIVTVRATHPHDGLGNALREAFRPTNGKGEDPFADLLAKLR